MVPPRGTARRGTGGRPRPPQCPLLDRREGSRPPLPPPGRPHGCRDGRRCRGVDVAALRGRAARRTDLRARRRGHEERARRGHGDAGRLQAGGRHAGRQAGRGRPRRRGGRHDRRPPPRQDARRPRARRRHHLRARRERALPRAARGGVGAHPGPGPHGPRRHARGGRQSDHRARRAPERSARPREAAAQALREVPPSRSSCASSARSPAISSPRR